MKLPRTARLLWTVFLPATGVAVLGLGYLGYGAVADLDRLAEENLSETNARLAREKVDRIERKIIDTENVIFDLTNAEDLEAVHGAWHDTLRVTPFIRSILLLDGEQRLLAHLSKRSDQEFGKFERLFLGRILEDLNLDALSVGVLKHLHRRYGTYDYLFASMARLQGGALVYTVIEVDMANVLGDIFVKVFNVLVGEGYRTAVLDYDGRVLFGHDFVADPSAVAEVPFPSTLYRWRLRLAPPEATIHASRATRRQATAYSLIAALMVVIFVGVGVLAFVARQEHRLGELKSEFVSNVSHELKTPLSLIRMFADLLAMGQAAPPDRAREYLSIITRESERLSMLIDNVLDFSRLESGEKGYEMQPVDLGQVVRESLDVFRPRIEAEGHRLSVEIAEGIGPTVADRDAIALLLLNLLDNAIKHAAAPVEIRVSLGAGAREGEVVLGVADDGAGIAPEHQRRIFERFYRVPRPPGAKRVRGSGIGLALVQAIAQSHGGRVEVKSQLGRGSVFTVRLPLRRPAAADAAAAGPERAAEG